MAATMYKHDDPRPYLYKTNDFGETWTTVDGHPLTLPLELEDNPARVFEYSAHDRLQYTIDLNWDHNGNPVLLYGHLDKQPEMTGWREGLGPWTPVREGDRLYGRGSADDGYAVFAATTALQALQAAGGADGMNALAADELTYGHSSTRLEGKSEFVESLGT